MLRNLAWLTAEKERIKLDYVQIDDGYQAEIGDWLIVNDTFPRGMRFLSSAIRERGFTPGLWLAPFLLSQRSDIYARRPEWTVRDEQGRPLNAITNWESENYALDTTNPDALQWLREVLNIIVHDWGYDYLKIDFLFAAALKGRRYDNSLSSIQAYRKGLAVIREVAGERFVLGCGAPLLPSVGLVEGMRVGPDIGPYPSWMQNASKSSLNRNWMNRRLWINDPDCIIVRKEASELSLTQIQSWLTVVALSGGMALLSDDLSRLDAERAGLLPIALPPLGEAATPLPPYADGLPQVLRLEVRRQWERWLIVALFNWEEQERDQTFNPFQHGETIGNAGYHLFDFWTGEHRGPLFGAEDLQPTPGSAVRLMAVHRHRGRPQLVGSTLHLSMGAVELADERWKDNQLTLSLRCKGEHSGALHIYVPKEYALRSHAPNSPIEQRGEILVVPLTLRDEVDVQLRFDAVGVMSLEESASA